MFKRIQEFDYDQINASSLGRATFFTYIYYRHPATNNMDVIYHTMNFIKKSIIKNVIPLLDKETFIDIDQGYVEKNVIPYIPNTDVVIVKTMLNENISCPKKAERYSKILNFK